MKKTITLLFAFLVIAALTLTACGGGQQTTAESETEETGEVVPAEYADLKNPVAGNADAVAAGQTNYERNCASCHGASGKGDGAAGASLDPKPADLTVLAGDSDGEMYWHIAEGVPDTAMPAWKGVLSQDEIWQVVSYTRTLK